MGFFDILSAPFKAIGSVVSDVVSPVTKAATSVVGSVVNPVQKTIQHGMDDATHVATGAEKAVGSTVQSLGHSAEQTLQPLSAGIGGGVNQLGGGLGGGLNQIGGGIGDAMKWLPLAGVALGGLWLMENSKRGRDPMMEMMEMQMMKRQRPN